MAFRQKSGLYEYLTSIIKGPCFPQQELEEYLTKNSPSDRDCLSVLKQSFQTYDLDCTQYKLPAVAIWLCGIKNLKQSILDSLSFFQTLMRSRLLMILFDLDGTFSLSNILTFLNQPLTLTIRRSLQQGYSTELLDMLRSCNKEGNKYNQILFLLEWLLVKKIMKILDEESSAQFLSVIGDIMPPIKMERILNKELMVKMKYTGYLRVEEDSCDTYTLTFKDGKLMKCAQKGSLPHWVLQAYVRTPKPIDMTTFRSNNVLDVFLMMSQAEVYASSPMVDDLESLIKDEQFQMMFQSFLLGHPLAEGEYQFRCKSVRETVQVLKDKLQAENEAYRKVIARELFGLTPRKEQRK